jgi:hypothetical protein
MYVKKRLLDSGADILIHVTNRLGLVDGRGVTGEIFEKYPEVRKHYEMCCAKWIDKECPSFIITQTEDEHYVLTIMCDACDTRILQPLAGIARFLDTKPELTVAVSQNGDPGFSSYFIDSAFEFLSDKMGSRKLIVTLDDESDKQIFYS